MFFIDFIKSSIGKKWIMACTGCFLLLFLCSHAAGNATLFHSITLFQAYSDQLHGHPLIIAILSKVLLMVFAIHIVTGVLLFFQNRNARSSGYRVRKRAYQPSLASRSMFYSGLFIMFFILGHTYVVSFGDSHRIGFTIVELFASPLAIIFYIVSFIVLAIHLNHGFWSMLQTFGINHPRYNSMIRNLTYIIPVFFLLLFSAIPLLFVI